MASAAVGEAVEEGCCHLGIAKDRGPFAELKFVVMATLVRS